MVGEGSVPCVIDLLLHPKIFSVLTLIGCMALTAFLAIYKYNINIFYLKSLKYPKVLWTLHMNVVNSTG